MSMLYESPAQFVHTSSIFCRQVLCAMLEFEIIESSDMKMQIITTLQSTPAGKRMYAQLCERQIQLRELVRAGRRSMTHPRMLWISVIHIALHWCPSIALLNISACKVQSSATVVLWNVTCSNRKAVRAS